MSDYSAFCEEVLEPLQRWIARGVTQDEIDRAVTATDSLGYACFDVDACGWEREGRLYSSPSLWEAIMEWDRHYRGSEVPGVHFYVYAVTSEGGRECIGYFSYNQPVIDPFCDEVGLVMDTWDAYSLHRKRYQQVMVV